jgi:gluconate 2-dehydrogenase gamma chain
MQRRNVLKGLSVLLGTGLSGACQRALDVPAAERVVAALVYDREQQQIAHLIADLIIPETDTPGALAAGVGEFIDYVVSTWFQADEQQRFIAGLADIGVRAQAEHSASFVELTKDKQVQLLQQIEASQMPASPFSPFGSGEFFAQIKELTVVGYYTSEVGATQERKYVPMPGHYDGYHKYADVSRQWAR